jgi:DNA-binding response OmpR family regulator
MLADATAPHDVANSSQGVRNCADRVDARHYRWGNSEIDIVKRTSAGVSELQLTPLELCVPYLLAASPGRSVLRISSRASTRGTDHEAEGYIADRYVRNLRARLEADGREPRFIATAPASPYSTITCTR